MKRSWIRVLTIVLLLLSGFKKAISQKDTGYLDKAYIDSKSKTVKWQYYLKVMDSLVLARSNDSTFVCKSGIYFMETETGIISSGETTFFGRFNFTRDDLVKWHEYYDRRYKKRRKNNK